MVPSDPVRVLRLSHESSGLRAILVIDSTRRGPAAGGTRTACYASEAEAEADARRLARAMTLKCALAEVDAGGAKMVVLDHSGLDRPQAFARLGDWVQSLDGEFHTAGDLGTTDADLAAMATRCDSVHADTERLAAAVGRGLVACAKAGVSLLGIDERPSVAVQGCGTIGSAAARALATLDVDLTLADTDRPRASALAASLGARVIAPDEVLFAAVDVLSPCAVGHVVRADTVDRLAARLLCGAANNIVHDSAVGEQLMRKNILLVPDIIVSAGAVVLGVAERIMGVTDAEPLIDRLGTIANEVLCESRTNKRTPTVVAEERALRNL